jgi:hypothetical protein
LGPKKYRFRAHPFQRPEKWIFPHSNPFVQPHINNRYIGNFMDKRQERDRRFQGPFRDYNKRVKRLRRRIKGVDSDLKGA